MDQKQFDSRYVRDHNDVIAASRVETGNCSMPYRIVLRDVSRDSKAEYVTHLEVFDKVEGEKGSPGEHGVPYPEGWKHFGYSDGHYFSDMKDALLDFAARASGNIRGFGKIKMRECIEMPASVVLALVVDRDGCVVETLGATVTPMSEESVNAMAARALKYANGRAENAKFPLVDFPSEQSETKSCGLLTAIAGRFKLNDEIKIRLSTDED